ncbi:hypothetical protein HSX10_12645 [Winogradskyella undariae]|uniref:hypothetical protein n=2 Tax=Flavobacteriaceae TaxID=49546 RepID=UPI00156A9AE3|nr:MULTISPECIES: hypothetical protein [Winogradskyella]NRR92418.1 hypothetical protein [Winogradskyella undariae]QNK78537.1 hypothetical protein H7F37_05525 [Winogradskyella sp. PAMC22761]QXP78449.1 hypothetical protein H0I32_14705 [Winogradskyella sp. HaHa_3_26]
MKNLKLLLLLLIFSRCDVSTLGGKAVNDLSKYKATILIETNNKKEDLRRIKVSLSDGDKQIINDEVKILVNNIPMELYVKDELYYTKTSFYTTDSLSKKASYYFEIILPDSTKHALAFIKPNEAYNLTKFEIPDTIYDANSMRIKWTNLLTPHQLKFNKFIEKPKPADNITSNAYDGVTIDSLKTKHGEYKIPKSYLMDSENTIKNVSITLNREQTGLVNLNMLPNSSIVFSHTIYKTVMVDLLH